MQLASVKRLAGGLVLVEAAPPAFGHGPDLPAETHKHNQHRGHDNQPCPKIDLDVGPGYQPKDEKSVHVTPPFELLLSILD
jgi:hypothetical protein